jgi:dTDP-4-amino-4,6-dideoxygalactose transaminase
VSRFVPFALPDIDEDDIAEVVSALRSGWITTGPKTKQFEADFAAALQGEVHAVAVNSATAGLHLALEAIGVSAGDEVITTTHTFTATAEVARYLGADVRLVDINPRTYCIDPAAVERAITPRTKAILPVHYAGKPCAMSELTNIAERHGIDIVEDAAHAFPAYFGNRIIGTLDTAATVFSFYATKTIATGEGGMLVTANDDIARRARVMRLHGIDRDAFDRYTATKPAWMYEVVAPGFKYNMTDVAAALGIQQLKKAWRFLERRKAIAARYDAELRDLPLVLPPRDDAGEVHAWHLYVAQLRDDAPIDRDEVIQEMSNLGVGCSVHYIPLHVQPYWRQRYQLSPSQFPHSQRLYERGFSLPIYTKMTDEDQDRVIAAMRAVLTRTGRKAA